jgi:hypothetical protein
MKLYVPLCLYHEGGVNIVGISLGKANIKCDAGPIAGMLLAFESKDIAEKEAGGAGVLEIDIAKRISLPTVKIDPR